MVSRQYSTSTSSSYTSDSDDSSSVEDDEIIGKYKSRERRYARSLDNLIEEISKGQFKCK